MCAAMDNVLFFDGFGRIQRKFMYWCYERCLFEVVFGDEKKLGSTVEPLNKGHFGANSFVPCREVVPISEVK